MQVQVDVGIITTSPIAKVINKENIKILFIFFLF